jgi:hypothetical protein
MDNDKLNKIAYNCRKATLLIEKQLLGRLTTSEHAELKIHLAGCSVCQTFQQQSVTINKMVRQMFEKREVRLNSDFKKSLEKMIERRLRE